MAIYDTKYLIRSSVYQWITRISQSVSDNKYVVYFVFYTAAEKQFDRYNFFIKDIDSLFAYFLPIVELNFLYKKYFQRKIQI